MSEQEKKRLRNYGSLNSETKPKNISEIISLWPLSSPDLNPLITVYGVF